MKTETIFLPVKPRLMISMAMDEFLEKFGDTKESRDSL